MECTVLVNVSHVNENHLKFKTEQNLGKQSQTLGAYTWNLNNVFTLLGRIRPLIHEN